MSDTEMRQRFENWMSDEQRWPQAIQRSGEGYLLMQSQSAWVAWQSAWSAGRNYEAMLNADDSPYCECGEQLMEDEIGSGICSCCGKPID